MYTLVAAVLFVIGFHSLSEADDWIGKKVFCTDSVVVMVGDQVIEKVRNSRFQLQLKRSKATC